MSEVFEPWYANLLPASWRGIPFAVESSETRVGRRTALHEYPWRNEIWVEDLGRGVRAYSFYGFVVGDDCYEHEQALLAAAEIPGPGTLVHPTLGARTVALVGPITTEQRADRGRSVGIRFEFLETASPQYPASGIATQSAVTDASSAASVAATGDFLSSVGNAIETGAEVVAAGTETALAWAGTVEALARDAAIVGSAVAGLAGNYGRYSFGNRTGPLAQVATVDEAIAAVTAARAGIGIASALVGTLAGAL